MFPKIRRVAVLGAGVMGSGIAAHLANAGIPSLMLDIVPPHLTDEDKKKKISEKDPVFRNRFAAKGLEGIRKSRPALLYSQKDAGLISIGNLDDDLPKAAECDWIIEVVLENLSVKKALYDRVEKIWKPGMVVSSNTSGIAIAQMMEGRSKEFRRHFLVTHFFNPVRYMKLLELVPGEDTDPEILRGIAEFGERRLGKGIVYGKDTPNFIGNRIGVFAMMVAMHAMKENALSIEEVDKILGPAMGRPKSAAFGTADLVGIDTLLHVSDNVYRNLPGDPQRETFLPPPFVSEMVKRGWLGRKAKSGFFKMEGKGEEKKMFVLDHEALDYRPTTKVSFPSLDAAKGEEDVGERIRKVIDGDDKASAYAWKVLSESLLYAAKRIPEIAADVVNIDNAIKWGFNWALGPFETWDAIGVAESAARMRQEGKTIPENVEKMLAGGITSFYRRRDGVLEFYDFAGGAYLPAPVSPDIIFLPALKERNRVVKGNQGATLYDLGDGVLCLEFHTKMNAIDADIVAMMNEGVALAEKEFAGMVIANHAENFCVGANLMLVFMEAQNKNFDNIEKMVREFQNACMRLRYSEKPVVAAPAGMALGGGTEICLGADRIRAAAETYMGLVEVGVGLLPAGGGTKEMVIRHLEGIPDGVSADPLPFLRKAFETIGMAKVATSAKEARELGFLRPWDKITIQRDFLIQEAKNTVLAMNREGYEMPRPRTDVALPGRSEFSTFAYALYAMRVAGQISEYDELLGRKIAFVMTGGDVPRGTKLSEQDLLDLEREAFLSLCGEEKTQSRIQYMLMKGKPLRN
ncbi:MAG TPA: 3-hydroxyacyl-CoA dehydrogenase/enoyl-CoA hydratase family protein [Candidatus Deferrimicrobiaceae bacterium]|nr:3-hydroxyacyl-CoA dehydrogenase/enoyl-CoA hydratase family protein [Candidatus Deferrimicrobiaceae bacterium]